MEKKYRAIFRIARDIPAKACEVADALKELGYIQKDPTRQRSHTFSEKGMEHGYYANLSYPVFDESVFEEVKNHIKTRTQETMDESLSYERDFVEQEEESTDFFKRNGYHKIDRERVAWLMSYYSGVDEDVILGAAMDLGLIKKENDIYVPTEKGLSSGVREERTVYFNTDAQKAIYDS